MNRAYSISDVKDGLATLETIRAENAKRETRMILAVLGVMVAGITILGFILN